MQVLRKLLAYAVVCMSVYIFSASPMYAALNCRMDEAKEKGRMRNVKVDGKPIQEDYMPFELKESAIPTFNYAQPQPVPTQSIQEAPEEQTAQGEKLIATNIEGGLKIKNQTAYPVDIGQLLRDGTGLSLKADKMQILIIHTHSSEAYTPAGFDMYEASDRNRTEDTKFNIVRVGDELTEIFQSAGLNVVHDRNIYDYPSYTGSYTRSGQAVEYYLMEYPDIRVVIDLHRDSLGENGVIYKTLAEEEGKCASQVMLLVGTDESGLEHDGWRDNLALAMYLQKTVSGVHPTLMRPVMLVPQRYNQHLTPGSLILEVGSDGNTLQEALEAVRMFGAAAAPALKALVE